MLSLTSKLPLGVGKCTWEALLTKKGSLIADFGRLGYYVNYVFSFWLMCVGYERWSFVVSLATLVTVVLATVCYGATGFGTGYCGFTGYWFYWL